MGDTKDKVTFQNILAWVLVGILLMLLIFQTVRKFDCSNCITGVDTVVVYKPVHDTIIREIEVEVPKPYKVEVPKPYRVVDTFWLEVQDEDLLAIAKQYYKKRFYNDTITDDHLMAVINEEVFTNKIVKRQFSYSILKEKETTITEQVDTRKGAIFIGPYVGTTAGGLGLGASLMYQTKNDHVITLHGDALNEGIFFSTYWKLRKPWNRKE